jgi:Kef-type K+ transport system membrane component KefB
MSAASALAPAILLLFVGILAILCARPLRLSPIVGYIAAGAALGPHGLNVVPDGDTTHLLADLGVAFLLFDIGLTFSLRHVWDARREILGLGPLQGALCAIAFSAIAAGAGLPLRYAVVVGATLALSSSAAVMQTIVERRQQSCPVGLTATAILIFQDVWSIFLLILVVSLGGARDVPLGVALASAAGKAALAFAAAVLLGRFAVGRLFDLLSRSRNEEIFTATALLTVLGTTAATSWLGISSSLGPFLGGMIIAETPYRHVIQTEVKPFRGLLLGFFFITVGMSLTPHVLVADGGWVLLFLGGLVALKGVLNAAASLAFRWSVPGSIQLGFLLAQGDEFAFVILGDAALRSALGGRAVAILITGIAASLALTPAMAAGGRRLAGRLRRRASPNVAETTPREVLEPVVIVGMSEVGRTVADGLEANGIGYTAVELDPDRFAAARADGYPVVYGDPGDVRLMATLQLERRSAIAIAIVRYEVSAALTPVMRDRYPDVVRFIAVEDSEAAQFDALGMRAVVSRSIPKGLELAAAILAHQGVERSAIAAWMRRQQDRALDAIPELRGPTAAMARSEGDSLVA